MAIGSRAGLSGTLARLVGTITFRPPDAPVTTNDSLTQTVTPRGGDRPRSARAAVGVLTAVHPPEVAWSLTLGEDRVEIGRRGGPGVPALAHRTVSRAHLAIAWDERWRQHVVADLGGRNPVRVDGARVTTGQPVGLATGAVLVVGDVVLVYERGASDDDGGEVDRTRLPGEALAMRGLRRAVARAAPDPSPVLLVGPTGVGKESVAREVHRLSQRRGELVAVNCAALSPELIESQLFGHVRGAFTGATSDAEGLFRAAQGGSLFLDEIGELPASLQPKLLRALQEREVQPVGSTRTVPVDVRVIAATNRDLVGEVDAGRFRRDLYARLALFDLRVPALRERRVDILGWVERLRAAWRGRRSAAVPATPPAITLSPEAAEVIVRHDWPENLRGLDRLIHHLEVGALAEVGLADLPPWLAARGAPTDAPAAAGPAGRRRAPPADELRARLAEHGGNVAALARHYGCDRRQVYRWLAAIGLTR
jgi:DNA-binding NtrC family response regulator